MKTNVHFSSYLTNFFLEWEMFQTKVVEKWKHIAWSATFFFFRKSCRLWENVEKYCRARQATDYNMAHALWMVHNLRLKIHALRLCNTDYFSTATMVARTRPSVRLYVYCLSCYNTFGHRSLSGNSVMKCFNGSFSCISLSIGCFLHWLFLAFFFRIYFLLHFCLWVFLLSPTRIFIYNFFILSYLFCCEYNE
jgi:hypothetical protein